MSFASFAPDASACSRAILAAAAQENAVHGLKIPRQQGLLFGFQAVWFLLAATQCQSLQHGHLAAKRDIRQAW